MLAWSTHLFRVAGIPLELHWSFFLLLAGAAWEGWREAGWTGLWWHSGLLVAFFGCVVLHELGHCLAARRERVAVRRILLLPIGGMAQFETLPPAPRAEVRITLAGPAVNFLLAGLLALVGRAFPADAGDGPLADLRDAVALLVTANLVMGLFNLLPAFPMDGGRLLRAALAMRLDRVRATFWAATTGKVIGGAGALAALWFQPLLAVLFGFVLIAGEVEYRAERRRARDEAQFRAVLERLRARRAEADGGGA